MINNPLASFEPAPQTTIWLEKKKIFILCRKETINGPLNSTILPTYFCNFISLLEFLAPLKTPTDFFPQTPSEQNEKT